VNVCEPVVCERYPAVKQAIEWLTQYSPARMTGTGSCVFASFATSEQAQATLAELPTVWSGFVARSLNTSPALNSVAKI
jgi:4-diphosphocytidyl-2-C-methyl-D-erythritol kinase